MKFIHKYFSLRIYRKIIFSYSGIVLIAIFLVAAAILSFSFMNATKEIHTNSMSMLTQTSYTAEVTYEEVINVTNQIISDNTIISFLYTQQEDKVTNYHAFLTLNKLVNAHPFIDYIELYNPRYDNYFSTANIPFSMKDIFKDNTMQMLENKKDDYLEIFPRKFTINWGYRADEELSVLSFVFLPDFFYDSKCAVIINIKEDFLSNFINRADDSPAFSTFIMNPEGQVLSHSDSSYFMEDFSAKGFTQDIFHSDNKKGTYIYEINSHDKLITYAQSEKLNWYFVSVKPYNQLLANIYTMWKITLIIVFIFIVLGILSSALVTNNIYNPIKLLIESVKQTLTPKGMSGAEKVDEFTYLSDAFYQYDEMTKTMESYIDKSAHVMERNYILNIIKGSKRYFEETDKIIDKPEIFQQECNFCIVLFSIDNQKELKLTKSQESQALSCFTLSKVAGKLLSKHYINYPIITDENEVSVLIQLLDDSVDCEFYTTLEEIQSHIQENLGRTVSISVGDTVYTKDEIADSYKSARKYIKCKLFYGHNCIINEERTNAHTSRSVRYPYGIEKKTFEHMKLQNLYMVYKHIDEFIAFIEHLSYSQAINFTEQFVLSIYNHFIDIECLEDKDFVDCFDTINEIDLAETIDDIKSELQELCANIIQHLKDKHQHPTSEKHKKIIEEAKYYIHQNYADPNLSLELLASKVALSPGYLGKLFKNTTSVTFVTYLNNIRLNKAKELLMKSSMSASKIGETVGIYNSTYFSTLFKKAYGMTPSQYRNNYHSKGYVTISTTH